MNTLLIYFIDPITSYFGHIQENLLIEILFLIAAIWASGKIFRKFKLPDVVGQLLCGIIIGPPVLGLIAITPTMKLLAELGSFFIMLFVGLEIDLKRMMRNFKRSLAMASLGVLFPFIVGFIVAFNYLNNYAYAFFIALTMAATSIAVTERLLSHLKHLQPKDKATIIGAAAITDMMLLLLFSSFMSYLNLETLSLVPILINMTKLFLFFIIIGYFGFILFPKYAPRFFTPNADGFTFILLVAFIFGLISELLGLHFVFGAFMAGLFAHDELAGTGVYAKATDRMYAIAHGFLGPIFFLSVASHIVFSQLSTVLPFVIIMSILAFTLKLIGVTLGSLSTHAFLNKSIFYGLGMNGRGAVSLVMANVAYSQGIINDQIFSIIIVIAIICTIFTPFFLNKLHTQIHAKNINPIKGY